LFELLFAHAVRALLPPDRNRARLARRIDDHALLLDCRCLFDVDEALRTLDAIALEGDGTSAAIS
jgi:hypothetical protein